MKPIYLILRQRSHLLSGYTDDLFLQGDDFDLCTENIVDTGDMVTKAGFTIHPVKISLDSYSSSAASWVHPKSCHCVQVGVFYIVMHAGLLSEHQAM